MFHCVDDELDYTKHFETKCRGNPDIKPQDRSRSKHFEDCKISDFCTMPDGHNGGCN